jgi:hypothetical protein
MCRRIFLLFFVLTGCASYTNMPEPTRIALDLRYKNRKVELKQSCYYGDLYDENEKFLLSPYPFDEVFHIVDLKNEPIHPKGQRGIIPAGTLFVITAVEFPDWSAMSRRMLTTPRYNPWVYLKLAPESTGFPTDRSYILVLPMGFDTEQAMEAEIARVLAPDGEMKRWLGKLQPTVRVAVEHKDVAPGMTSAEMEAAWGRPRKWLDDGTAKVGWYPSKEVWIVDDKVTEIKASRTLENAPTPKASAESGG